MWRIVTFLCQATGNLPAPAVSAPAPARADGAPPPSRAPPLRARPARPGRHPETPAGAGARCAEPDRHPAPATRRPGCAPPGRRVRAPGRSPGASAGPAPGMDPAPRVLDAPRAPAARAADGSPPDGGWGQIGRASSREKVISLEL